MESARSGSPEEVMGGRRGRRCGGWGGNAPVSSRMHEEQKERRTEEMASPDIDHEQMEPESSTDALALV